VNELARAPLPDSTQSSPASPPPPEGRKPDVEKSIVAGLAKRPAYLLIFALCFIGLTAGSVLAFTDSSAVAITLAFSVVVGIVAAVVIILRLEKPTEQLHLTGLSAIDTHLKSISDSLKVSLQISHPEFQKIVIETCAELDGKLADIKNGQVRVDSKDYNVAMHTMLSSAKTSVFCVHRGDYLLEWFQRIGRSIISSHKQSGATATHLFVFNRAEDVTEAHQNALATLDESQKVDVFVYFDKQDFNYRYPEDLPRDYTLLDGGDAICVTDRLESDGFSGTWYFNDSRRKARFNNEFSALKRESRRFSRAERNPGDVAA